uniref:Uncharacterized protein n=1 Tax=Rhizophora mucronata TaxID=61149 RepID=A0A2P2P7Y1_RHIMU
MSFGITPALSIRENISAASFPSPCRASPAIIAVHVITFLCFIFSNTCEAFVILPDFAYMSISALLRGAVLSNPCVSM